jgi:hypothetical protein
MAYSQGAQKTDIIKEVSFWVISSYSTDRTQPNRKRTKRVRSEFALGLLGRTQSERKANPKRTLEANADIY